ASSTSSATGTRWRTLLCTGTRTWRPKAASTSSRTPQSVPGSIGWPRSPVMYRSRRDAQLDRVRPQKRDDGMHATVLHRIGRQIELAEDATHMRFDGFRRDIE